MSSILSNPADRLPNEPKNIEELRAEILADIREKLAAMETYDFRELPIFAQTNQLAIHSEIPDFFDENRILSVIFEFKSLAVGLLTQFESFIVSCQDYDTLVSYRSGLESTTKDFRRWKTIADAQGAETEGEKTTLQYSIELTLAIVKITAEGVSASRLILDLSALPGNENEIRKLILKSSEGFPGSATSDYLREMYEDFERFLQEIGSTVEPGKALTIIGEYIMAAKLLSDQVANPLVKDTFSNIFNILGNYFNAIYVGSLYK